MLRTIDRRILDVLTAHDGPAGIYPDVRRIAQALKVTIRYARQRIAILEEAGLVRRVPCFERDDDPEWLRRGHRSAHRGRQTANSYRLVTLEKFRGPPGTKFSTSPEHPPSSTPRNSASPAPPEVPPIEEKDPAGSGYQGDRDQGAASHVPPEPVEIAIEPPAAAQLDHDPGVSEVLATLTGTFGPVQVQRWPEGREPTPPSYRTGRGLVVDLEPATLGAFHAVVDQLDRDTCINGPCRPGSPCRRHQRRRRTA